VPPGACASSRRTEKRCGEDQLRYLREVLTDFRADLAVVLAGQPGRVRALADLGWPAIAVQAAALYAEVAG
jgi:hypothetical protein